MSRRSSFSSPSPHICTHLHIRTHTHNHTHILTHHLPRYRSANAALARASQGALFHWLSSTLVRSPAFSTPPPPHTHTHTRAHICDPHSPPLALGAMGEPRGDNAGAAVDRAAGQRLRPHPQNTTAARGTAAPALSRCGVSTPHRAPLLAEPPHPPRTLPRPLSRPA